MKASTALLIGNGGLSKIQLETSRDHVELPSPTLKHGYGKQLLFLLFFIFWPSGGYIPVNLGNSKRRPMPYYCYLYTPGAASGIYYYIKSRKTGAMKLGKPSESGDISLIGPSLGDRESDYGRA
jgi:hypothetical protein